MILLIVNESIFLVVLDLLICLSFDNHIVDAMGWAEATFSAYLLRLAIRSVPPLIKVLLESEYSHCQNLKNVAEALQVNTPGECQLRKFS